jgi:flagellar assembly protein FliH
MAVTSFLAYLQPLQEMPAALPPWEQTANTASHMSVMPSAEREKEAQARAAQMAAEAEQTRAQARQEASGLLEDARLQAEAMREAAWQEGFHEGREAGQTAAEVEMQRALDDLLVEGQAHIQTLADAIGTARQQLWNSQEAEMVSFVLQIARQVVKTEVTQNPEVVTQVLQNALRRVTDKDHVRIRVSLPDAAQVRGMREDLLNLMDGVKNLEIVDDRRIGQGGCVVETNAGTIDAKIETQLDEVERALAHALDN